MNKNNPKKNLLGTYINSHAQMPGLGHFFLWMFGYYKDLVTCQKVPSDFLFPNLLNYQKEESWVSWINHSTFLIHFDAINILTDPIWSERCSPIHFFGPKRHHPPPFPLEELPYIHYVIISHNHYDHLDLYTIRQIGKFFPQVKWIVPKKVKAWFLRKLPFIKNSKVIELSWWESYAERNQGGEICFTGVPAQHFSGRGLFDRNRSLWMGCVVEMNLSKKRKSFYFAGDTGYNEFDFKEIGNTLGPFDLSLIPIGTYCPRSFMRAIHINPEESVKIHCEVGSKLSIGGHWMTFLLSEEPQNRPPYDLYCALIKKNIPLDHFRVLKPGQKINW
jgi:N-acyl-phosphatidylethanolamine-hydrolysing phospholipase D